MYSTNSASTGRGTRRTVICAVVHGQTASITNTVYVADALSLFLPRRAFAYVKEAQMDTLHDAPSGPSEVFHTMDYSLFQSLIANPVEIIDVMVIMS